MNFDKIWFWCSTTLLCLASAAMIFFIFRLGKSMKDQNEINSATDDWDITYPDTFKEDV